VNRLSKSAFEKASNFIAIHARTLEQSLFEFQFEDGSIADVKTQLRAFQNSDGGFGNGLEPDLRMPQSSPFASTVAFQVLREIGMSASDPMVVAGLRYFEQTFDRSIGGWDPTGSLADQSPHAPWWNYEPVSGRLSAMKRSNPGAEIVGYLHLFSTAVDPEFLKEATDMALTTFEELSGGMEVHSMMCFMRLAEMASGAISDRLEPGLRRGVHSVVSGDPETWRKYGGRPLWFAPTPKSLLADELADSIQLQLEYEVTSQQNDGSWQPNWEWGQYLDDWEVAKVEWSGYMTLRNLLILKAWDRL